MKKDKINENNSWNKRITNIFILLSLLGITIPLNSKEKERVNTKEAAHFSQLDYKGNDHV